MLRQTARSLSSLSISNQSTPSLMRPASSHSEAKAKDNEEVIKHARQWLKDLSLSTIPQGISDVSYLTSSKPGGQNANRTHSKVRLQTPLKQLLPLVPTALHATIRNHRCYVKGYDSIVFTFERSRRQKENREACFRQQFAMLRDAGNEVVASDYASKARGSHRYETLSYSQMSHMSRLERLQWRQRAKAEAAAAGKKKRRSSSSSFSSSSSPPKRG